LIFRTALRGQQLALAPILVVTLPPFLNTAKLKYALPFILSLHNKVCLRAISETVRSGPIAVHHQPSPLREANHRSQACLSMTLRWVYAVAAAACVIFKKVDPYKDNTHEHT
jgi:hypothetical protein